MVEINDYLTIVEGVKEMFDGKETRYLNLNASFVANHLNNGLSSKEIGRHLKKLEKRKMLEFENKGTKRSNYKILRDAWKGGIEEVCERAGVFDLNKPQKSYVVSEPIVKFFK